MTEKPPQPDQPAHSEQSASFEESLAQLGDIVARLESGSLGLSESIAAYEHGVTLLRRLHDDLGAIEERVRLLVRIDDQGRPVLEPLPSVVDPPAAAGRKPAARSTGTARRSKTLPGMDDPLDDA